MSDSALVFSMLVLAIFCAAVALSEARTPTIIVINALLLLLLIALLCVLLFTHVLNFHA